MAEAILTANERKTLEAIANRIFPPTDSPGAVEIGAVRYIEIALAGDYAAELKLYRQGLRALNRCARQRHGNNFAGLAEEQQDDLLRTFEEGSISGFSRGAEFFETARYHVLEGVFCESKYGGNKDMTGWRLVGFPGQQHGYDDAYINRRVDLEPVTVADEEGGEK